MNNSPTAPESSGLDRICTGLALLAALFAAHQSIVYRDQPLLDQYAFRQTQTALTAEQFRLGCWKLAYETPVLGHPYSIPFEFPFYQMMAGAISAITGAPLDAVGRLLSLIFLLAIAVPARGLVAQLQLPRVTAPLFLALLWSCPLYIYWGRSFMIETAALFLTFCAMPFAVQVVHRTASWGIAAAAGGLFSLAILQKATTAGPVILLCGLIGFFLLLRDRRPPGSLAALGKASVAFGLPIIIALAWTQWTDSVKEQNILGQALTSRHLKDWNFGTLAQRLDPALWKELLWTRAIKAGVGGVLASYLFVVGLVGARPRQRWLLAAFLAAYVLPYLIFTNLHSVHYYYQVANYAFLVFALAILLATSLRSRLGTACIVLTVMILMAQNGREYAGFYRKSLVAIFDAQSCDTLEVAEVIRRRTAPESGMVVFGKLWSSEVAYYAQRRSVTVPNWFEKPESIIAQPANFLGPASPESFVFFKQEPAEFESLIQQVAQRYPKWHRSSLREGKVVLFTLRAEE
jgi:4-amino-4-deoxy-L-arabinose transferase-like glycosyltransferase